MNARDFSLVLSSDFLYLSTRNPQVIHRQASIVPTIALTVGILVTFALALGGFLVLGVRYAQLRELVEMLNTQVANVERSERLTPARLAELAEVKAATERATELLTKVNRREIAAAKRRDHDGTFANGSDKDELRRRAGLVAGKPAPHQ